MGSFGWLGWFHRSGGHTVDITPRVGHYKRHRAAWRGARAKRIRSRNKRSAKR